MGAVLTGVFYSTTLFKAGSGNDLPEAAYPRVLVQLLAALAAAVFSFVVTFALVKIIDLFWGFCLDPKSESEGLDRTEHGEVGFDLGLALELASEGPQLEPRAAVVPRNDQKRFTVVVDGAKNGDLIHAWSELCQVSTQPPTSEFKSVYHYVTTVQGNRFRFRGGEPDVMRKSLEQIFKSRLTGPIQARVEN